MAASEKVAITPAQRLGKRELGPYAFEERMPARLVSMLTHEGDANRFSGVIERLAGLIEHDQNVETAYLCSKAVDQIWKLPDEGPHFCGYRNIQMLWSVLHAIGHDGLDSQASRPSVLDIQDMIEKAWDAGFNEHGRAATGGVRGTRKYIGTSEAEALMLSLRIPCTGRVFDGKGAWDRLLDSIDVYFSSAARDSIYGKVRVTGCMPIFLQRPKHSITVVGFERTRSGKRRLLFFDPAWRPPAHIMRPLDFKLSGMRASLTHRMYRKNQWVLNKSFQAFETLEILRE
ncbi:hypothetical protein DOTSEDRAFT_72042 [Dothistroma septosporum NZE10]|uniref:UFSP1/2/DUB catalytic domain-containing protein n=1 Tax=Dothistroma septosporum (strain NZE10 / CBS 128990) TaxID=675120 RepID=N1PM48_DOTSN|nr:hypothetical protein DOTSEDRAFT_72042 [Dothistroma septosporum NZE10]